MAHRSDLRVGGSDHDPLYLGKVGRGPGGLETYAGADQTKLKKRLPIAGTISMSTGAEQTTKNSVEGAIRWAVGESNRRTNSFVMYGSSAPVPGGMKRTAITC